MRNMNTQQLRIQTCDYCDWEKAHEFSDLINVHDADAPTSTCTP